MTDELRKFDDELREYDETEEAKAQDHIDFSNIWDNWVSEPERK